MRAWADCRSAAEKGATVRQALALAGGRKSGAAAILGLNRQYFYEIHSRYVSVFGVADTADTTDNPDTTDSVGSIGGQGVVGSSSSKPLTYGRREPILSTMTTALTMPHENESGEGEPTVRAAFDMPKRILDWLETEALRRKQSAGGRMAKSPIIVELVEKAMREGGQ